MKVAIQSLLALLSVGSIAYSQTFTDGPWTYTIDYSNPAAGKANITGYIGPMAQDFHATFGLGSDDKTISTLDSDGVMYAAIQGLVEELKERDRQIAELKARSAGVDELRKRLEIFEDRLNSLPPAP